MARPFRSHFQVRSYELDILGHVNNAVYLNWLEQSRLEAFQHIGYPLQALIERRWVTQVVRIEIDYRREVRFGDRIAITTELERIGRSSIGLRHQLEREGDSASPVSTARVVVVWMGSDGRPAPVPEEVREALARLGGSEEGNQSPDSSESAHDG